MISWLCDSSFQTILKNTISLRYPHQHTITASQHTITHANATQSLGITANEGGGSITGQIHNTHKYFTRTLGASFEQGAGPPFGWNCGLKGTDNALQWIASVDKLQKDTVAIPQDLL